MVEEIKLTRQVDKRTLLHNEACLFKKFTQIKMLSNMNKSDVGN